MDNPLILVTGGAGHLGRPLVRSLLEEGARVRMLTRRAPATPLKNVQYAGADDVVSTGAQAFSGVAAVIHIAHVRSDPLADARGTLHLLGAARAAGPPHFTFVSIVGARRARKFGHHAGKARGEELVEASGLLHLIARATRFHHLIGDLLARAGRLPWLPVPDGELQPVAVEDVAGELARQGAFDFAGTELRRMPDLARIWLEVQGRKGRVVPLRFPLPQPFLWAIQRGVLTEPNAVRGSVTWEDVLGQRATRG